MCSTWKTMLIMFVMIFLHQINLTGSVLVGVNYGLNGNNLPAPKDVVKLLRSNGIQRVRIFEPNAEVLQAFRGSDLSVSIGTRNEDLAKFASSKQATTEWLNTFIIPYQDDISFQFISLGNEAIPGPDAQYILPALRNMFESLQDAGLDSTPLTTVVSVNVLGTSYPPSQGVFKDLLMIDIVRFLSSLAEPLMVNVYPYFSLIGDPTNIPLDYALMNATTSAFRDNGIDYYNLLDAQIDAFAAAIARALGKDDTTIIVSETGWPSAGGEYASVENARIFNTNFKRRAIQESQTRYGRTFESFIFALFNENLKEAGAEQNFGTFYPNMQPVYPLW